MRVCLISEAQSYHTQRWAKGLAEAGCDVHLISADNALIPSVKLHTMPIYSNNPLAKFRNNYKIEKLIKDLHADVTHIFGLFSMFSLVNMLLARKLKNLVISVWGSDVVSFDSKESFKDRYIKKYLLNCDGYVVATSRYLAKKTQKYIKNSRKVRVVPWGVDLKNFRPKQPVSKPEVIKIGFAKRLHTLSAPEFLLEALHLAAANSRRKLKLRIAGDGPMKSQLVKLTEDLELEDSVEWIGWLSDLNDLGTFYRSLDYFVMPSRTESFGVSAVEAAASGLPVIGTKIGGIPEIVVDGETGILVEAEDVCGLSEAMTMLGENDELRMQMGVEARRRAETNFNWEETITKTIGIYQQACG